MDTSHVRRTHSAGPDRIPLPAAAGFEHHFLDLPGLRAHVAAIGEGAPVLMLHGFPQHWWQWRQIAPAIAATGHRVICPDLRGSGWTEASTPQIGADTHLHDLLQVMDALGVERAHVVAHDLGAISAMQLAYQHPDRVRSLVQLSVPPGFMRFTPRLAPAFRHMPPLMVHRSGQPLRWLFSPAYVAGPMTEETVDTYLAPLGRPEVDRAVRTLFRGMVLPAALRLMRGVYRRMTLRPPTLAVFGRQDGPFTEGTVRRICRGYDGHAERFELAFVDDAAHFITDDAPGEVTALIRDWIARSDATAVQGDQAA
ncbi:alpha/beta fold hydrolase [Microbacterium paludicola]|uniref:alpha/beta fold hydrolase n=1 Tax=Microbacterium paludicola TaxID=300019 RepID=UPI0011A9066A|nr:alpha/beta hydrolase [Microbacterium paludicola]